MTSRGLLERLSNGGSLVVAEGYLLEFERRGYLKGGAFVPEIVLEHPDLVRQLHEEFVHAGSDVVLAFTYYAHRKQLRTVGRGADLELLNSTALKLAREVADKHGCLMAGNLCNTNVYDKDDLATHETVENMFKEQIELAVKYKADYIVAETIHYYGEAKIALESIKKYGQGIPAVITLSIPPSGVLLDDLSPSDACQKLQDAGAAVVGLNCGMGPATMLPLLKEVKQVCKGPVAALPVAYRTSEKEVTYHQLTVPGSGIPAFPNDLGACQCGITEIAEFARACKDIGIQYIGLCCGNSSNKVRAIAETYGRKPPASKYSADLSQSNYYNKLKNQYDNQSKYIPQMLLNSLKSFQNFNASAYSKSQMADMVAMANPYYAGRMTCSRLEKALYLSDLLKRLENGGTLVVAEGYIFEFERRGYLQAGTFVPEVILEHPELVKQLYEEFVHAGSDVVLALTYYAHREKLRHVGRENDLEAMNIAALKMAREVADDHGCLMAGNICNSTVYRTDVPETNNEVENIFKEQVELAVKHGADFIVGETFGQYGEAKLALDAIKKYGAGVPAVITYTTPPGDNLFDGVPIVEACKRLEEEGAAVVGLNCGRGPATMLPLLKEIKKVCKCPVAALPVAYRTSEKEPTFFTLTVPGTDIQAFPLDLTACFCSRKEIAEFAKECKKIGIEYVGLCCGNSSHFLRILAEIYEKSPPASSWRLGANVELSKGNFRQYRNGTKLHKCGNDLPPEAASRNPRTVKRYYGHRNFVMKH